ncbi:MAG: hypothetical protein MUE52_07545 [Tabrizicola sp.]|jgi:hypothetical protein|nr:hypothetical protein [Tabrizicola sp.]
MHLKVAFAVATLACALPAFARTPLTGDAFEAFVTGTTITYQQYDFIFGTEEYLEGRKVRWTVAPNQCLYGSWYPEGDDICFVYEDDPTPHCWTFWMEGEALMALSTNGVPGEELTAVDRTTNGLSCPGPDVGV